MTWPRSSSPRFGMTSPVTRNADRGLCTERAGYLRPQERGPDRGRCARRAFASTSAEAGSHSACRPDLSAWSKAIANGYPLAAVTGTDRFREAATQDLCDGLVLVWRRLDGRGGRHHQDPAGHGAIAHMECQGGGFAPDWTPLAAKHGVPIRQSGPVRCRWSCSRATPTSRRPRRSARPPCERRLFASEAQHVPVRCTEPADIDFILAAADAGFKSVAVEAAARV